MGPSIDDKNDVKLARKHDIRIFIFTLVLMGVYGLTWIILIFILSDILEIEFQFHQAPLLFLVASIIPFVTWVLVKLKFRQKCPRCGHQSKMKLFGASVYCQNSKCKHILVVNTRF